MRKIFGFILNLLLVLLFSLSLYILYDNCFKYIDFDLIQINSKEREIEKVENIEGNFKQILLGDKLENVKYLLGDPDRIDLSTYGFKWHVYNRYEGIFFMVGIDKDKVVGLYSNTTYNDHLKEIELDNIDRDYIEDNFKIFKRNDAKPQYDIIKSIPYSITLYYDIYKENKIDAYEVIKNKYINQRAFNFYILNAKDKSSIYTDELKKSLEYQMFDLLNSTRYKFGVRELELDSDRAYLSSKKHALDMEQNNYFEHNNLKGESPFDRMIKEGIDYYCAGENLAKGQISAIQAHNGLMNSKGHRKTILMDDYEKVGVAIEFGGEGLSHYVQNYYAE